MKKRTLSFFLLVITMFTFSLASADSISLTPLDDIKSKEINNHRSNFKIESINQNNATVSGFNASITIIFSTALKSIPQRTIDNFIDSLNKTLEATYPNISLAVVLSDAIKVLDFVTQLNNATIDQLKNSTLFPEITFIRNEQNFVKDYLIIIGRDQKNDLTDDRLESTFNASYYEQFNVSSYKTVSFIDVDKTFEQYSYQNYNTAEAGFLAGAWAAFASKKQFSGVVYLWGEEIGFQPSSAFVILNSHILSGIFSGFEYVKVNYLGNPVFPMISKKVDASDTSPQKLQLANSKAAEELFTEGVDVIVAITNNGDEGILKAAKEKGNLPVILVHSYPMDGYDSAAFIYPDYTKAVMKQISLWEKNSKSNTSELLIQQTYKPNTEEYPFLNAQGVPKLQNNTNFNNLTNSLALNLIEIPNDYLRCRFAQNCPPEKLKLIPGFTAVVLLLAAPVVLVLRRKFRKN